jgi:hypothetical protein
MSDTTGQATPPAPPPGWVPVEHRVLGIDKRTIAPALLVLGLLVVLAFVVPAIDDAVPYDDPIVAGDVMDLVGGRLTFVPAEGWNRVDGSLVGEGGVEAPGSVSLLTMQDISVSITTGEFEGTPDELLDQVNRVNEALKDPRGLGASGPRQTVTTDSGLVGVAETFTGLDQRGVTGAFVVDVDGTSVGVEVVVKGSVQSMSDHFDEIVAMLDSIALGDRGDSEVAA